jgi:hypothetical protein
MLNASTNEPDPAGIRPCANTSCANTRSRPLYALVAVLVVGIGLLWRSGQLPLSSFIAKYGGDALWALLVFCLFGFIFRRISTARLFLISICFAWAIEFSQLYHAPWIDSIRSMRIGRFILGTTFNLPDLLAYLIGVAIGAMGERLFLNPDKTS